MGYELKKLMNMYGVSTPTMAPAPQMPGAAPTAPTAPVLAEGATRDQRKKYEEDLAAFNASKEKYATDKTAFDESVRKYGLDKAQYDQYAQNYQNRLANTNMYNQAQFSTTGANVPPIMTYSDEQVAAPPTGTQYGTPQWTDAIRAPSYGMMPITFGQMSEQDRANWYNTQRGLGYTDADLRANAESTFGQMSDPDFSQMTGGAYTPPSISNPTGSSNGFLRRLREGMQSTGEAYTPPSVSNPTSSSNGFLRRLREGMQSNRAEGGYIQNYAKGGEVQGYQRGGPPGTIYGGAGDDMLMGRPADDMLAPAPAPVAEDPQDAMRAMLESYIGEPVDYSSQIAAATERRAAEQKALEELLMGQVNAQDSAPESKAEMYLRLAAAFGAPTKTGHFSENLALAGQTMADELAARSERERAEREKKLGVQTELQKMRLDAAGEEVDAYRGLQESETQYRRDLAKGLIKDYMDSGKPQTEAAKMASDMGLTPGTPEYNEKVREIIALDIAEKKSLIDARLAMRDNVPAAFAALDHQARAAGFLPESEGGDGSYEEFMATRGSGLAAEARVLGTARGEATAAAPVDVATADKTLEYIEEIRNHPGKSIGTGGSSYLNVIRGTPGYGFQKRVDQLTSGAFLTAIEQLRGMGALSNAEGQTAKDAVTRMDTAASEEEFDAALSDYENVVKDAQDRARARLQEPTAGAPADGAMPSDEDLLNMYGN